MYMATIIFMLMPFQPLILRVANTTTRPMLHRVEYYIDMDKYYFPILIHGYFTIVICVTSIIATDSIFIIFVQHICGLFVVIGWVTMSYGKFFEGRYSTKTFLSLSLFPLFFFCRFLRGFISWLLKLTHRTRDTRRAVGRRCRSCYYKGHGVSKYGAMCSRSQGSSKVRIACISFDYDPHGTPRYLSALRVFQSGWI